MQVVYNVVIQFPFLPSFYVFDDKDLSLKKKGVVREISPPLCGLFNVSCEISWGESNHIRRDIARASSFAYYIL